MLLVRAEVFPERGQWMPWLEGGRQTVLICCPECGRSGHLSDHEITLHEDGTFSAKPSIRCPQAGCDWHVRVDHSLAGPA